jgi:hypothetical protein
MLKIQLMSLMFLLVQGTEPRDRNSSLEDILQSLIGEVQDLKLGQEHLSQEIDQLKVENSNLKVLNIKNVQIN